MPLSFSTIPAWLERHREKLIDALLLCFALNYAGLFSATPPAPWPAQVTMLAILTALASPRAHLISGLWQRYLRLLPGYAAAVLAGGVLFVWWFGLPRSQLWFAPLWLALTALARLPLAGPMRRVADYFRKRRLDIVGADLGWVGVFSCAVPRWSQHPAPSLVYTVSLMLAWAAWHWFRGSHDPAQGGAYRRGSWAVLGLAFVWGLLWQPSAGTWPALVFAGWLGLGLLLTRLLAGRFAAPAETGSAEVVRWLGLAALTAFLFHPFASANARGADDARYYATFLADTLAQLRQGVFPVFVGQSEYQFNGAVIPIRVAPGFQYLGGLLDLLTGRTLATLAVQNLLISLTALAAAVSSYVCLRRTTWSASAAWLLALLFLTCPGIIGLAFISDLYMSWLTVPWVPVVVYLSCRSFAAASPRLLAGLGFSLGVTWWLHAPIALWLTLVAAAIQLGRMIWRRPAWRLLPAQLGCGAAAFLLTAAYPLVSATLYAVDPGVGSSGGIEVHAANILQQLIDTFPGAWLPLSTFGRLLSDFQIGYGLLAVSVLVLPSAWRTRQVELRLLAVAAALLLLLLLPIPRLNLLLWEMVPGTIRVVTNTWAMQRLYVVIAGCLVFLAGATWSSAPPAARLRWLLVLACCWSAFESIKFVRGSWAIIGPRETITNQLLPENITLTRYSYGLFRAKPAYFTHGVTDPVLEHRFLAPDLHTGVGGNQTAAARLARAGVMTEHVLSINEGLLTLRPALTLQPGRRYLAEVVTSIEPFPAGALILKGSTMERIYGLPEYGESRSFGLGGDHVPYFALHTTAPREEVVQVQFFPQDQAAIPGLDGRVKLRLAEYDAAALPVQIHSWMPLTATVRSDGPVWLETPRMHQTGYAATVDGHRAEVTRSAAGLASVPVPAGVSEVVLRYAAPAGLQAAFWLSLGAIGAGWLAALLAGWRALRAGPAARATPAAPGL